jgi:hypothetical protein
MVSIDCRPNPGRNYARNCGKDLRPVVVADETRTDQAQRVADFEREQAAIREVTRLHAAEQEERAAKAQPLYRLLAELRSLHETLAASAR